MKLYIRYQKDTNFKYEFYHSGCSIITAAFSRQYKHNGKCIHCDFTIPSIFLLNEEKNYLERYTGLCNRGAHYPIYLPDKDLYNLIEI